MVKDAEANAAEDKIHDLVTVRNQADNMIHAVTKSMKDAGDKSRLMNVLLLKAYCSQRGNERMTKTRLKRKQKT